MITFLHLNISSTSMPSVDKSPCSVGQQYETYLFPGIDGVLEGIYTWSTTHTSLHGLTTRTSILKQASNLKL